MCAWRIPQSGRYVSYVSTTTDADPTPGRRGRPPLPATEAKILAATREILAEGGVASLTMEGVAVRAGVAKTTVYRRYRSRDDLALAVLIDMVRTVTAGAGGGGARAPARPVPPAGPPPRA